MPNDTLTAVCNKCDTAVQIDSRNDDHARVHCPVCGSDFGTWGEVQARMSEKHDQPLTDRSGWRSVKR